MSPLGGSLQPERGRLPIFPIKGINTFSPIVLGHDVQTGQPVQISYHERKSGIGCVGVTGSGKTTLLTSIADADIKNGHGLFVFDPLGGLINNVLSLPSLQERMNDVILWEPGAMPYPFGINLLARSENKPIDYDGDKLMNFFKKLYAEHGAADSDKWGQRIELNLRNGIYTLLYCGLTLAELPLLFDNRDFRLSCLRNLPANARWLKFFWQERYNDLSEYMQDMRTESILNRVLQILDIREMEYIVSQHEGINWRELMDTQKIILMKLSSQSIGSDAVTFLGTLVLQQIFEAAMSREDERETDRPFCGLLIDEYHSYLSPLYYQMLPKIRQYNIGIVLASQVLSQTDKETKDATQQLGTHVIFRVIPSDADSLAPLYAKEPAPDPEQERALISTRPIDHIVSRGITHPSEVVTRFCYSLEEQVRRDSQPMQTVEVPPMGMSREQWEDWKRSAALIAEMERQGIISSRCEDISQSYLPSRPASRFRGQNYGNGSLLNPGLSRGYRYKRTPQTEQVYNPRQLEVLNAYLYEVMITKNPDLPFPRTGLLDVSLDELREVAKALAATPILTSTLPTPTTHEMRDKAASTLVNLPDHRAYVKRGASVPEKGASGSSPVEIETIPLPSCDADELEERIEQALENASYYGVERSRLEDELQARYLFNTTGMLPSGTVVESIPTKTPDTEGLVPARPADPLQTEHPIMSTSNYLEFIYYLSNLTLAQAMKLTGTTDEKKEREKITRLDADGLVATQRATFIKTGGASPAVYSLKKRGYERLQDEKELPPIRQGDFNRHSYTVNEFCIAAICGAKTLRLPLVGFEHEKQFRQKGIMLEKNKSLEPDAWLQFLVDGSLHSIYLEINMLSQGVLTEGVGVNADKVHKYLSAIQKTAHSGFSASQITIAFVIPDGSEKEEYRLLRIIEGAVKNNPADGAYFLVAAVNLSEINASEFLTDEIFLQPFDNDNFYALIE